MLARLRRLPLLLILVAGVSALFLLFNYDHEKKVVKDKYGLLYQEKIQNLETFIKIGAVMGHNHLLDDLNNTLESARLAHKIDFYVLQYQGSVLWFGEKHGNLDRVDIAYPPNTQAMSTPTFSYRSMDIGDGYQLTLGFENDFETYFAENKFNFSDSLIYTQVYAFFIILVVGLWTLRDFMLMVREMKRGKSGKLAGIRAHSAESNLFMRGLAGYAQAVSDLEAENIKLGRQVLPSLQKEIHSGRKPPYDFDCTMVRTDINHFSTIFNTHNVTEFMATINEFFDEVSRVVARYGGLVHEFVGDEVIFYFKDDDHRNSFAIALSAVRDINKVAEVFHQQTVSARGYPFTVKSSLAHGKVRFGPLVGGFTIAGSVLIETVRVLGYIAEKDENVVYFDGINESRIKGFIQSQERMSVKMKGYQNEVSLHQYIGHLPLQQVLETLKTATIEHLGFYRGDEELEIIIENLQAKSLSRDLETTLKAIRVLREPYVASAHFKLGPAIRSWINDLERTAEAGDVAKNTQITNKILSAVVKLYINLVPLADFSDADREQLNKLMLSKDRRVVANTVEVLTHFSVIIDKVQKKKIESIRDDLRIAANAIVLEGRDELTPAVIKKLKGLLKSKNPGEMASGLYALGELASMHRTRDFAYLSAHVDFQALISQIDRFAQHTTTMVRRQALAAARKTGDEAMIEKIRLHVKDSGSELLAEELTRYLDNTSSAVQKSLVA